MAITHRAIAKRRYEDMLIDELDCLDCDAPRGQRCRDQHNRERVTCCWARDAFGKPRLAAHARFMLMLAAAGVIEWPWS